MGMQFRRSKKVGPFNFTVSKTGVSGSVGVGPFRYTMNSKGGRTKTIRTGIPGLYYQEREDSNSDYPYQKGVNFPCSTFLIDLI